jgi:DNA-binding GntR family transcriptional regulator
MRQVDLADAVGLGRTHVNAALAQLQSEGLLDLGRGHIAIKKIRELMKAGEFNEDYLHLHREVERPK